MCPDAFWSSALRKGTVAHSMRTAGTSPSSTSTQVHPSIPVRTLAASSPSSSRLWRTGATPARTSTANGQLATACHLSAVARLLYTVDTPSVTASSVAVSGTTVCGRPRNPPASSHMVFTAAAVVSVSHRTDFIPKLRSITMRAASAQFCSSWASARTRPTSTEQLMLKSGMHMTSRSLFSKSCACAQRHRCTVAMGVATTVCTTALTRQCRALYRLKSRRGYSSSAKTRLPPEQPATRMRSTVRMSCRA